MSTSGDCFLTFDSVASLNLQVFWTSFSEAFRIFLGRHPHWSWKLWTCSFTRKALWHKYLFQFSKISEFSYFSEYFCCFFRISVKTVTERSVFQEYYSKFKDTSRILPIFWDFCWWLLLSYQAFSATWALNNLINW